MSQSLNVIALISGGKDSIYSILHCLQNGHKVVALGNVYPLPMDSSPSQEGPPPFRQEVVEGDEENLNSYMYQTVGHTVIPLFEQALGIPLYRQPIMGNASATGATYDRPANGIDETESLVPLLQRIMAAHPEADAVSTGAILSTYQRTRVESVAVRLGLIPLSFLWQYPSLVPASKVSLLEDMSSIGLDARIVKTASWALDESFLWQNVASGEVMRKIEQGMARFGNEDGAALGEGGEFETLAVDGPDHLFRGRIVVEEEDRQVIRGSAGTAWVRVNRARVEMKPGEGEGRHLLVRIPDILSDEFQEIRQAVGLSAENDPIFPSHSRNSDEISRLHPTGISLTSTMEDDKWTVVGPMQPESTIEHEVGDIMAQIKKAIDEKGLDIADVISTLIVLRKMSHFATVNKIYSSLFTKPNPPARVTIACGDLLPLGYNIVVHLSISSRRGERRPTDDLHVQSRSYWAPANIGPYSQARSDVIYGGSGITGLVHVAGQIPLVPSTMSLPELEVGPSFEIDVANPDPELKSRRVSGFITHAVLSLQHLWRIGQAMDLCWWTGAVAYLSKDTSATISRKAELAAEVWSRANGREMQGRDIAKDSAGSDDDERDPWEERYNKGFNHAEPADKPAKKLPDWSVIAGPKAIPPFFAAEVEELPRGSTIEWQALFGITRGPITQRVTTTNPAGSNIGRAVRHTVADTTFSQTVVFIPYVEAIDRHNFDDSIDALLSGIETPAETAERRRRHQLRETSPPAPRGFHHCHTAYLDATIAGLRDAREEASSSSGSSASYAGVIPCYSLWGAVATRDVDDVIMREEEEKKKKKKDGLTRITGVERLAAVLIFQSSSSSVSEGDGDSP